MYFVAHPMKECTGTEDKQMGNDNDDTPPNEGLLFENCGDGNVKHFIKISDA
jgi:hypothetical protein